MEERREQLGSKPSTYIIRDEIETIVKNNKIDRIRFHEYSKLGYADIIKRFYYGFVDFEKFPYQKEKLSYLWLHFRKELTNTILCGGVNSSLENNLHKIDEYLRDRNEEKLFLILSEGWVYEGYPDEMLSVLGSIDFLIEDFYIISTGFTWCIAYCDDGNCSVLYRKDKSANENSD